MTDGLLGTRKDGGALNGASFAPGDSDRRTVAAPASRWEDRGIVEAINREAWHEVLGTGARCAVALLATAVWPFHGKREVAS